MNILIIKLSAIGDVIHTMPALVALRRHYPNAHISWLVEEAGGSLLQGHSAVDRVILWRRREFEQNVKRLHWIKAARLFLTVLRQVRDRRYDVIIDFQALLKSSLWVFLSKGKRKVGFGPGMEHAEGSYLFLNHRIPAVSMDVHALDRGLILLQHLGVSRQEVEYRLPRDPSVESEVETFLAGTHAGRETTLVVMHPVARWRTKLWQNESFAAAADALTAKGFQVVFSGSEADKEIIDDIANRARTRCLRFDGRGGLSHLAALCRRARVFISTDTGPMHLAAAVGTPVVALFGPTAPNRTGPYGAQHIVLRAGVECSPCFKRQCESTVVEPFGCMKGITVAQVVDAVMSCLQDSTAVSSRHPTPEPEANATS